MSSRPRSQVNSEETCLLLAGRNSQQVRGDVHSPPKRFEGERCQFESKDSNSAFASRSSPAEAVESCDACLHPAETGCRRARFSPKRVGSTPCPFRNCRSRHESDVCSFVSEVRANKSLVLISLFKTRADVSATGSPPRRGCSQG